MNLLDLQNIIDDFIEESNEYSNMSIEDRLESIDIEYAYQGKKGIKTFNSYWAEMSDGKLIVKLNKVS